MAKKKAATLEFLLAPAMLERYAGGRSHERGKEYYGSGAVSSLVQHGNRISAVVLGNRAYKANIRLAGSALNYDCTCPAGGFCKHLVATAMAWNAGEAEVLGDLDAIASPTGKLPKGRERNGNPDLRAYLLTLDKEKLAAMVLEQAVDDHSLRERLGIAATVANPDGVDLTVLRRQIDRALELPDFDDDNPYWDEGYPYKGYVDQLQPILDALESLLRKGQYASVAKLAEYSLMELNKRCLEMEYDFCESEEMIAPLVSLHIRACAKTKPDPDQLAEWVFHLCLIDTAGEFAGLPWEQYKKVLGKGGYAHFRRLVENEWAKIPALTARDREDPHRHWRRRAKEIMLSFAVADNDVDAQAAIIQKDLSEQSAYLELARVYHTAKRYDEALLWAEKGWNDCRDTFRQNSELRDFLAAEYRRRKRNRDASALYWNDFSRDMNLHTYQRLKKEASRDKLWIEYRENAFAAIREKITQDKKMEARQPSNRFGVYANNYWPREADNSLLVDILLWEKKPQDAWSEANAGGCDEGLWLRLSAWREKSHPKECIPIWEKRISRLTRDANQRDYAPAAQSLVKLGQLMEKVGERSRFTSRMKAIREDLKRRRSFIQELDKHHLP